MRSKTITSPNGKPRHLIFYNDEWMSFWDLAGTAKAMTNQLSPQILQWRWNNWHRSEAGLFATKDKRGSNKLNEMNTNDGGLFEECDRTLANACLTGRNKDLLALDISREPYITPGEKRRMRA